MTDQANTGTPGGAAPGGSPGGNSPGNVTGNFIRDRAAQMAQTMQQPAPGEQPAADAGQQQQSQSQQQSPPAEQKIRVGEAEYTAADLESAIAERAEAQSRAATLPATPNDYRAELSPEFVSPVEGARFELDQKDPIWSRAKEIAHKNGLSQEAFSEFVDLYAASRLGEHQRNATLRDVNLKQLGPAAPQRVDAIATWLGARAGKDGAQVANFLRQYPSAPIVRAMESLIKQFSSQGGADFDQRHRAEEEAAGKIPGYENMNFVQRRVHQMATNLSPDRGGPRRR